MSCQQGQHQHGLCMPPDAVLPLDTPACCSKSWAYLVDVDSPALAAAGLRRLQERPGLLERQQQQAQEPARPAAALGSRGTSSVGGGSREEPVVVVGSGPAGLFAALELAEAGIKVGIGASGAA